MKHARSFLECACLRALQSLRDEFGEEWRWGDKGPQAGVVGKRAPALLEGV